MNEVIHVKNTVHGHAGITDEHFPITITRHGPVMKRNGDYRLPPYGGRRRSRGGLSNAYNRLGKALETGRVSRNYKDCVGAGAAETWCMPTSKEI